MKKHSIILFAAVFALSLLTHSLFAQKKGQVEIIDDICTVDGVKLFKLYKVKSLTELGMKDLILANLKGERLAIYQAAMLQNTQIANDKEWYYEVTFLNTGEKCEIALVLKPEKIASSIIEAGLIKDGELDETAVMQYLRIYGTKYTQRRNAMNQQQPQTIIIQQQPAAQPAPQPGLNINVRVPR